MDEELKETNEPNETEGKDVEEEGSWLNKDVLSVALVLLVLVVSFYWAGLIWWAVFWGVVGLVLLVIEVYLTVTRDETLSSQFWDLWKERPKVALFLWLVLFIAFILILLHLRE